MRVNSGPVGTRHESDYFLKLGPHALLAGGVPAVAGK